MFAKSTVQKVKDSITRNPELVNGARSLVVAAGRIYRSEPNYPVYHTTIAKILGQLKKEGYITQSRSGVRVTVPIKPGTWVRITKSEKNWGREMNKYVGMEVEVKSAGSTDGSDVKFRDVSAAMNRWYWSYKQGHFEVIEKPTEKCTTKTIKPGVRVRITKAEKNWSRAMDAFVGDEYVVDTVDTTKDPNKTIVTFRDATCELNRWQWVYEQGHFEVIDNPTEKCTSGPTKEQILEAAATSPEAKKALEKLFPEIVKPKPNPYEKLMVFGAKDDVHHFNTAYKQMEEAGLQMIVAKGIAPNEDSKLRLIQPQANMVVYDGQGNEIFRSRYESYFIGFEK